MVLDRIRDAAYAGYGHGHMDMEPSQSVSVSMTGMASRKTHAALALRRFALRKNGTFRPSKRLRSWQLAEPVRVGSFYTSLVTRNLVFADPMMNTKIKASHIPQRKKHASSRILLLVKGYFPEGACHHRGMFPEWDRLIFLDAVYLDPSQTLSTYTPLLRSLLDEGENRLAGQTCEGGERERPDDKGEREVAVYEEVSSSEVIHMPLTRSPSELGIHCGDVLVVQYVPRQEQRERERETFGVTDRAFALSAYEEERDLATELLTHSANQPIISFYSSVPPPTLTP
ncbi:hypothetical protein KIPB_005317 [Kipferlia bialata]|uniref:Uncharacterized protein n=1 Tax=Kipferlia bialata TaxID=797122 RepID=A0A9K3CVV0_9EUKA|nr:hypothetical protein KIPB_005317 [Kipferlia bialata]|eukprot:g5317.t1